LVEGGVDLMTDAQSPRRDARVLVAAASKHGASAEIAQRVGDVPRRRGVDVTVASPELVDTVDGYDAVVLGSAVYAGRWLDDAGDLADRVTAVGCSPVDRSVIPRFQRRTRLT
jgi:flavorubredoxin